MHPFRYLSFSLVVLLLGSLFSLSSCSNKHRYNIVGSLDMDYTLEGKTVYLSFDDNEPIDSAVIDNASFVLKGCYPDSLVGKIAYLRIHTNQPLPFIMEEGMICVLGQGYVTGTPLNKKLNGLLIALSAEHSRRFDMLYDINKEKISSVKKQRQIDSLYVAMQHTLLRTCVHLWKRHPDDLLGGLVLREMIRNVDSIPDDLLADMTNSLRSVIENNRELQHTLKRYANRQHTSSGFRFVDFSGRNIAGQKVKLSDYVGKGSYVLLDFWASWCAPCHTQLPILRGLFERYKDKNFKVVGAFVWANPEELKFIVEQENITWPQIISDTDHPTFMYGVKALPDFILFDPEGNIIHRGLLNNEMLDKINSLFVNK